MTAEHGRARGPDEIFCSNCGSLASRNSNFCPSCGTAIQEGASSPPVYEAAAAQARVEFMGFWIRVPAAIIDSILVTVVNVALAQVPVFGYSPPGDVYASPVGSLIAILYYVLFTGVKGQTLGKMALRIQVVDANGNVPGLGRAALREIGKLVSGLVILLGYFWIGWDRQKRGWHDHIAGTYVIRKEPKAAI